MTCKPAVPRPRVMVSRYGDDGPWTVYLGPYSPFAADPSKAPPLTLADRYVATATGQPPIVEVVVTDRETGATARQGRDERIVLDIPDSAPIAVGTRLLRDARTIIGIARRRPGGPAFGTGLQPSQIIAAIVELWHPDPPPDGTPPSQAEVAAKLLIDREGRTIRRKGAELPGPGKPWERLLRDARIVRHQSIVSG